MQESDIRPEIQQRIDREVSRIQDKIQEVGENTIRAKVYKLQINCIKRNPYDYFKINEKKIETVYDDLFKPLDELKI